MSDLKPEKFRFYNGPYECCDRPSIARDDPDGGDPHTIGTFRRINNPVALYELCALANERIDHIVEVNKKVDVEAALAKIEQSINNMDDTHKTMELIRTLLESHREG